MKIQDLEGVRRIVPVFEVLLSVEAVGGSVNINVHLVFNALLPAIGLRLGQAADRNEAEKKKPIVHVKGFVCKIQKPLDAQGWELVDAGGQFQSRRRMRAAVSVFQDAKSPAMIC